MKRKQTIAGDTYTRHNRRIYILFAHTFAFVLPNRLSPFRRLCRLRRRRHRFINNMRHSFTAMVYAGTLCLDFSVDILTSTLHLGFGEFD